MTIFGVSHIALGVTDLDRSLTFYRDLLGMRVDADFEQHIDVEKGGDLHRGNVLDRRQVWLRWDGEDGPHAGALALDATRAPQPDDRRSELYALGIHHISFWVDDIDGLVERANAAGVTVIMPHYAPADTYGEAAGGSIQSVFLRDPDGNIVQCDRRV